MARSVDGSGAGSAAGGFLAWDNGRNRPGRFLGTPDFSVAFWLYMNSDPSNSVLVGRANSWGVWTQQGLAAIRFIGDTEITRTAFFSLPLTTWVHVMVTLGQARGGYRATIYQDGVEGQVVDPVHTAFAAGAWTNFFTHYTYWQNFGSQFSDSALADVAIWNKQLPQGAAMALTRGADPATIHRANLLNLFRLNSGARTVEPCEVSGAQLIQQQYSTYVPSKYKHTKLILPRRFRTPSASPVEGAMTGAGGFAATILGVGSVAGATAGGGALAAGASGVGAVAGATTGSGSATGAVSGIGAVVAAMGGAGALAAGALGVGAVVAALAGGGAIVAAILGLGAVAAALTGRGDFDWTGEYESVEAPNGCVRQQEVSVYRYQPYPRVTRSRN